MSKDLILEVGTEEIPAGFIPQALAQLEEDAKKRLTEMRLRHGSIQAMGTPRRMVLYVEALQEMQDEAVEEKQGPPVEQAFDKDGNPTKAALGFAKNVGVEVKDLIRVKTAKGDKLAYRKTISGEEAKDILARILPEMILSLRFPKSMAWADMDIRFARPLLWMLALLGDPDGSEGGVVPFSIAGIQTSNKTRGHRFTHPEPFEVTSFAGYLESLEKADVVVDQKFRKELIEKQLARQAEAAGGELVPDPELLEEVTYLVEYPVVVTGRFDQKFLRLPPEVLIQSMRSHQRYFSIKKKGSRLELVPCFLTVCNSPSADPEVMARGNERVLLARLDDAEFFFQEDLKHGLAEYASELDSVVYQSKLGTYADKAERMQTLMEWLCELSFPQNKDIKERAKMAALLCKADLVSLMVGEFPGLQGIIGAEYARLQGEHDEVADAIREHYLPRSAEDIQSQNLPGSKMGALLSIADKMDAISGGWAAGLAPTGSQDPYALRRQALGVIHVLRQGNLPLNLQDMVERALKLLKDKIETSPEKVRDEVMEFFKARLRALFLDEGYPFDAVDSVLAVWNGDPVDAENRIKAVAGLKKRPDFEPLMIAFKRVVNIIEGNPPPPEPSRFEHPSEKGLHKEFLKLKKRVEPLIDEQKYEQALSEMAALRPTVDRFFDDVLVNVEDNEPLRINRHALLNQIGNLFKSLSDFSKIVIPGPEDSSSQGGKQAKKGEGGKEMEERRQR